MARAYCPHCGKATNMQVSVSRSEQVDESGNVRRVVTRALHCEDCGTFVLSEPVEEGEDGGD